MKEKTFGGSQDYVASEELLSAVNIAMTLQKPLLLKGEPGTGKTMLARSIASSLHAPLYIWNIKSTTKAQDGLYVYDVVQRLYDSQFGGEGVDDIEKYVHLGQVGEAFESEERAVLLIDEIDKADEEFEAFLLELLSEMQVTVPEIGTIRAKTTPFVILTSNRARPLSEALRRRCAYLHIDYPDMEKELAILRKKLPHVDDRLAAQVALAVQKLRSTEAILKKPSIAETLDWAAALDALGIAELTPEAIRQTAGFVLKNNEDLLTLEEQGQEQAHCGSCQGHSHG